MNEELNDLNIVLALGACGIKGVKPNVLNKSQDLGSRIIENKSCVLTLLLGAKTPSFSAILGYVYFLHAVYQLNLCHIVK